jgi:hypothetical protein
LAERVTGVGTIPVIGNVPAIRRSLAEAVWKRAGLSVAEVSMGARR